MVGKSLRVTGSADLLDLKEHHSHEFNLLLAHSVICDDCSRAFKAAFPSGHSTQEDQRAMDRRLAQAGDELDREIGEAQARAPERGPGTEHRGGDG
jgi:hypothetical protein